MLFSKLFKKTAEKAEDTITQVGDDAKGAISDAKDLMKDSKEKLGIMVAILGIGIATTIVANVLSIACSMKTIKSINKNNILMEIEHLLRK